MNLLKFFGELFLMGILVASLEMAYQSFMHPNNILYPWGVLLAKWAHVHEVWRHITRPLGRCRYCNSVWVSIYVYKYFYHEFALPVLLLAGISVLFVKLLSDFVFTKVDPATIIDLKYNFEYEHSTPVPAMMASYVILGVFYATIYVVIPLYF